jgi:hypothetical protein
METIKFKAKGVLLRHFESMGTEATEPFIPIVVESKQALLDHISTLMVDNIKACGMIVTTVSKTEDEDENYIRENSDFECVGNLTENECEKLRKLCLRM